MILQPRAGSPHPEVRIDALAAGGDGVARLADGRVCFVAATAPGDLVRVELVEERSRFVRARVLALLEPGDARTDPLCAVFGSCGGCAWQHITYSAQLAAKRTIVRDALTRLGGLALPGEIRIVPSPQPYGYRGRTRVLVRGGRVGYRRARSHALCATARCPVLLPVVERALRDLAGAPPAADGEWELVADSGGTVRTSPAPAARDARVPVAQGPSARVTLQAGGHALELSPHVFAQSNVLLLPALVEAVLTAAGTGDLALELYAGAGSFTLGLASRFARVVAVESDPAAARDLARNVAGTSVEALCERAEAVLEGWRTARPDVVVLDPPRRGMARGGPEALAALGAPRIVHVSCDPATLARDLRALVAGGYALRSVTGFDLFPQTHHVEALAVLERT